MKKPKRKLTSREAFEEWMRKTAPHIKDWTVDYQNAEDTWMAAVRWARRNPARPSTDSGKVAQPS